MPLLQGRDFGSQDNQLGVRTVIVNEALAHAFFPNQDPIGRHITIGLDPSRRNLEIVGVVRNAKYRSLREPELRIAYQPWLQLSEPLNFVMEVRASTATANGIRNDVRNLDPAVPVTLQTIQDRIRESLVAERVVAILSTTLAGVALLLASCGLYGLMAYQVYRRRGEIGVRMAVGASASNIATLVLRESLVLAAVGVAFGLVSSIALGRVLQTALFGITSTDPAALLASSAIMAAMALLAAYIPARRASRIDPAAALRDA
jgi:predicted lysophospholipase L1 biosynthesis ABC-type transport system permease subunit